ncbi:MAG: hypothetical protein LBU81_06430 [Methanosarcinales archaeon]|jgi:S-layer protein (TIGR01567 family)|nr:hypothetical protein [Methanosarcinales archaeon]
MNKILKSIAILLVLFTLTGIASADVSGVSADDAANGTNYDVTVSWTGTLADTTLGNFTITIEGTTVPSAQTNSSNTHKFENIVLSAATYTVNVTDDSGNYATGTFVIEAAPVEAPDVANVHTMSDSTDTHFNVSWDTWTPTGSETLELYNGTGWEDVTALTSLLVKGNTTGDTNIVFRANNSGTVSDNATELTVKPVGFSSESAANSIVWTLSNYTHYTYTVTDSSDNTVSDLSFESGTGKLTASNLVSDAEYTIKVRGNNSSDFGLSYTNKASTSEALPPAFLNRTQMASDNTGIFDTDGKTPKDLKIENDTAFNLKATADDESDFKWELTYYNTADATNVAEKDQSKNNVLTDTFSWKPTKIGKYTLKLTVNANGSATPTETLTWNIEVSAKTTGDRIWDASLNMPTTYNWTARSFSGFYYDLDTGEGSEWMTIRDIGRTIDEGDIEYKTTTSNVSFAYDEWNEYQIVGFMGDKYYAGYGSDSLMKNGNLSKVLIDSDESGNYRVGQYLALEEGYAIKLEQIDVNGNAARLIVEKDGKQVGDGVVNASGGNKTFVYEKNISNTKVPFIMIHVNNVFMGSESSLVTIDGIFQISDKLLRLESGSKIDKMEIETVSGDTITMSSSERVSLNRDSEVTLMGKMKFVVADSDTLRFAPVIEYTDPGIYEIRGTVSDFSNSEYISKVWTPQNFEGFYYDINDDITNSERIEIKTELSNSSRRINDGDLTYTATATIVDYEYETWGNYNVIGFMGEKYYAGTGGSLLKNGNLSKVLVDTDERRNVYLNQAIALEEGVSVRAAQIDVNGNAAQLFIEKDGKTLYSEIVRSGNDLNYSKKIGSGSENTTFVRVHVDSVFMGSESSIVSISGIFQASEQLTRIEDGTAYGEMEVTSVTATNIALENRRSITLSQDNDVEFMKVGNSTMYFKVGNNDTLRFAPVVEKEIGSTDPLKVRLSNSTVVAGETVTITAEDRGVTIEGVTITINGSTIGTTNASGQINYTTNAVGTFRINAEKSGYTAGNSSLTVNEKLVNMTVRVSPDPMYFGMVGTIKATDSLNGSTISDAAVYVSGENVGRTNSAGEFNYTFNKTGNLTITVAKEKYINGSTNVNISQEVAFAYSNFVRSPDEPTAKRNIKLEFNVTNNGIKNGSHEVALVLKDSGGNVIDSDNSTVSVNTGQTKSVSLSVKAPEAGNYTLTLNETDSNRTIDLPSGISSVSVGEAKFGSTILYAFIGFLGIVVLVAAAIIAYLFGVKGANRNNYKIVASDVVEDLKSKFRK